MFETRNFVTKQDLVAEVTTVETFNDHTGDVDQKITANVFDKHMRQIGWVEVKKYGNKCRVLGDEYFANLFSLKAEA